MQPEKDVQQINQTTVAVTRERSGAERGQLHLGQHGLSPGERSCEPEWATEAAGTRPNRPELHGCLPQALYPTIRVPYRVTSHMLYLKLSIYVNFIKIQERP